MTSREVKEKAVQTGTDGIGFWAIVPNGVKNRRVIVRPYVVGAAIVWKAS